MPNNTELNIAILGDSILDEYWLGGFDADRIIFSPESLYQVPGGAGNVACNIRLMGGNPLLYSCVGRSQASIRYRRCLRNAGVATDHLLISRRKDICCKSSLMNGSRRILRVDRDEKSRICHKEEEAILSSLFQSDTNWADLIVTDYQKGFLTQEGFDRIRNFCMHRHIRLYIDSASQWNLNGVFFYKPNRFQFEKIVGVPLTTRSHIEKAALEFKRRQGVIHMAVTMDQEGVLYLDKQNRVIHFGASCQDAVDPCGAGDTFIAALVTCIASGHPVEEAVRLANSAAGIACAHSGTYAVAREEIPYWHD